MAIGPTLQEGRVFTFRTAKYPKDELLVMSYEGRDALSRPYEFRIRLAGSTRTAEIATILRQPATLRIKQPIGPSVKPGSTPPVVTTQVQGVVSSFVYAEHGPEGAFYEAVLAPRLWLLSLTSGSRVFQNQSVPQIVKSVLEAHGLSEGKKPGDGFDFLFRCSGRTYEPLEYVVQYRESDLDFIHRLLEHEGIFYYFDHAGPAEMVVFGDCPNDYDTTVVLTLPFRPAVERVGEGRPDDWTNEEHIYRLMYEQRVVQGSALLRDYNYRTPDVDLSVSKSFAPGPAAPPSERDGVLYEYGNHYKATKAGKALAQVREEEIVCRERRVRGTGTCKSFRPGSAFELKDHPKLSGRYVIVETRHEGRQGLELGGHTHVSANYHNAFECLPLTQAFRPERRTPKPTIPGMITALVDAAGDGQYAELDDQGRYRVKLLLDPKPGKPAQASRAVRMAQPYAGATYGFHFPLHKGTEVLLTHVNGDPDRPVLASALYTPASPDVVKGPNQTQGILRSAGENELRFEDLQGQEQIYLHATRDWLIDVVNDKTQTVGHDETLTVKNDRTKTVGRHQSETIGENKTIQVGGNHKETISGNMDLHVVGNMQEKIEGNRSIQVDQNCAETVKENRDLSVQMDYTISVARKMLTQVTEDATQIIQGSRIETVKKDKTVDVKQELTLTVGKNHTDEAKETRTIKAKKLSVLIGEEISIKTGKAEIVMKKNGDILIKGGLVVLDGTKDVKLKGKNVLEN